MKNKTKIMNTKPEITDEEIRSYMDFDRVLLKNAKTSIKKNTHIPRNIIIAAVFVGMAFIAWFFMSSDYGKPVEANTEESIIEDAIQSHTPQQDSIFFDDKQKESTTSKVDEPEPLAPPSSSQRKETAKRSGVTNTDEQINESADASAPSPVYMQATPIEGYPALYEYFNLHLNYPDEALEDSIQGGIVTVVFSINEAGRPEKITIEQSLGEDFDREAIRLIENMPDWNPATYNGKPVLSKISLPITFQLKKLTPKE